MRPSPLAACAVVPLGLAVAAAVAAAGPGPVAPARLEVSVATVGVARPGTPFPVRVTVRNVGIEDLYDVQITGLVTRNAGVVSKERGSTTPQPGALGDLPVGRSTRVVLAVVAGGRTDRKACGVVRVRAGGAHGAASVCVPVRARG